MTYFEGIVAPVPAANKDAYLDHVREVAPLFQQALSDQLAAFAANQPQPEGVAA